MQGVDGGDPLVLQFKEATASVLEPYTQPSAFDHHGARVVAGQRIMQAASDIFIGWTSATDAHDVVHDSYVRQLARHEVLPGPVRTRRGQPADVPARLRVDPRAGARPFR